MNVFDIVIILLILTFALAGWKRGVIKEVVSLIGIILVFATTNVLSFISELIADTI